MKCKLHRKLLLMESSIVSSWLAECIYTKAANVLKQVAKYIQCGCIGPYPLQPDRIRYLAFNRSTQVRVPVAESGTTRWDADNNKGKSHTMPPLYPP